MTVMRKRINTVVLPVLALVLVLSVLLAVTIGSVQIPFTEVYKVILYEVFGIGSAELAEGAVHDVVWLIRLPRLVLAVGVGMALAISGIVMQSIVRNPLADPYILGISSGSYLGAVLALLLGLGKAFGGNAVGVMAFIGAFIISLAVVALSNVGGKASAVKLILAGTALSAVCSAFSNFIVYRANDSNRIQTLVNWTMGSLGAAKWNINAVVVPIVFVCVIFFWSQFRTLNLMLLGDEAAISLGVDLHIRRILYLLVSALMVGLAVYSAGMIGFVGLIIPHAIRMIFGSDHRTLVPICALTGSVFLIWADVLCRIVIRGAELPIGILTSMIGAPIFVYLMARRKYSFGV